MGTGPRNGRMLIVGPFFFFLFSCHAAAARRRRQKNQVRDRGGAGRAGAMGGFFSSLFGRLWGGWHSFLSPVTG